MEKEEDRKLDEKRDVEAELLLQEQEVNTEEANSETRLLDQSGLEFVLFQ